MSSNNIQDQLNKVSTALMDAADRLDRAKALLNELPNKPDPIITQNGLACRVVTESRYQELVKGTERRSKAMQTAHSRLQTIAMRLQDINVSNAYRYVGGPPYANDRTVLRDVQEVADLLSGW